MKQDGSIALFQYWNRLRGQRAAPKRTEIEPADIKSLLADTFILERDMRGKAIFRLAGTRLCATYGGELRSLSFTSLWIKRDQGLMDRLIMGVFDQQNAIVVSFQGHSRNQRTNPFEMVVLPLNGGVDSPRCIGIILPVEKPFWLGADPILEGAVASARPIQADQEAIFLQNRAAIDVPALSPAYLGDERGEDPSAGTRRIRHLVVYDGGRTE
ncbi:MAG: PAS domain-containing protein [Rhizobiaceae bacterium]|nr:PAS domain-containing protein [Rhizobiaceae bacterium]